MTYDFWRTNDPNDWSDGEGAGDCTCPRELGAGGRRKADRDCPVHGIDPDAEHERMHDDDDWGQ